MHRPVLLDLRNVYAPARLKALGFEYHGVGRGASAPVAVGVDDRSPDA
jgi:hypothetical protein